MAPKGGSGEEQKELDGAAMKALNQGDLGMPNIYDLNSEFIEFTWDPEVSAKEVQFSADCRHIFLCESNYYFRTVVASRPFTEGVHYWEIIADSRTEHEIKIGVTTQ